MSLHEMTNSHAPAEPQGDRGVLEPRTLAKADLLQALAALRALGREYRTLLERVWDEDAPDEDVRPLIAAHREAAVAGDDGSGAFGALAPAEGLLRYVLPHLRGDTITYRLRGRAPELPGSEDGPIVELSHQMGQVLPALDGLVAHVFATARATPAARSTRVQRVLYPIAALFKAIVRQDWSDAALVMDHLNMVTTSRESHALVEQIGRLVRSIYDGLAEISSTVPLETLSDVSEEIPDAVEKLNSVIAELETGANRNLDLLEALIGQVAEGRTLVESARSELEACDSELAELAATHPDAAEALDEVRRTLAQDAGVPLAAFEERLQESHDLYMTLFANQSYQDLTGQTLKKVIAFIESLQFQLIQVISKESGKPTVTAPVDTQAATLESGPDARDRLSQDKVDAMLAELGF